jgi:hypothetical protein
MALALSAGYGAAASVAADGVCRNLGEPVAPVFAGHMLTPNQGGARMLYAPTESDDPTYRATIAEHIGGVVDYFDARFDTPDAALLGTYDCVHIWSNYPFSDAALFGDRLADFVDAGGKVILGAYSSAESGNALAGRIVDPLGPYAPIRSLAPKDGQSAWDGVCHEDCIWRNVAGVYATHRETLTLEEPPRGVICGHHVDGEIAVAYLPNRRVTFINGAGGFPIWTDFYMAWVVGNACLCEASTAVESSSWGLVKRLFR